MAAELESVRPCFAGVWAVIFEHGNVASRGEASYGQQESLPTYRAHNKQGMALAAAFANVSICHSAMVCTTSTGPGSYHVEYGYSCMGYKIAGRPGVKLANPDPEGVVDARLSYDNAVKRQRVDG